MWENINCGDLINCGRLSSLLWVVLNAIYFFHMQIRSKVKRTKTDPEKLTIRGKWWANPHSHPERKETIF